MVLTSLFLEIIVSSTIPILLVLSVLLCVVLGAGHSLTRSREIGVHRLLGLSVFETMRIESWRQRRSLVSVYIVGPLIVAGVLYFYSSWALDSVFWSVFFLVSLLLSGCLFLGYLGGQYLVRRTSIPQSIKGRLHARPILHSLISVRCVALFAALSSVAALVGASAGLTERQHMQAVWDAHRGPQEFALNTNTAFENYTDSATATPFRAADKEGELLLIDPYWMTWPVELEAPVLLVNQKFAKQAGVPKLSGEGVTVCSPVELSRDSMRTIEDSLEFEANYSNRPVLDVEYHDDCRLGTVFTYDVDSRTQVDDPILVILPPGLGPLSDHNLMSGVSRQVVVSSSSDVPSELLRGSTGNALSFLRPREDSWQMRIRTAEQGAVLWGLNTFAAVLLVAVLVGATVITFRVAYRRKIHVAYICGRSPWWVSKWVVIIESGFFLATIGWLIYKVRDHLIQADLRTPSTWNIGFDTQWSPLTIAAIICFGAAWLVVSISVDTEGSLAVGCKGRSGTTMTIYVRGVSCAFRGRTIIRDFSATFEAGRVTALTGASGSGKTTLLNMLGGLIKPDSGSIEFDGRDIAAMGSRARRKFRRSNVWYLFQDYGLVSDLSVTENIKIAVPRVPSEAMAAALAKVGLEGSEKRTVSELSGGEQQRIALARLILTEPKIVLADEPTGALDQANSELVLNQLREFAQSGAVVVVATHSAYIADNADGVVKL